MTAGGGRGEFDRQKGWRMTTGREEVNLTARGVGAGCERVLALYIFFMTRLKKR